jgi:NADH-quinone oxidoreductase subunit J
MGPVFAGLHSTKPDLLVFFVASAAVLVGAIGVVVARHPVHSALMLIQALFGVAVLFVMQQADFLAAVQVIVYAGAIVVLFLFVIMLVGVDREESIAHDPLRGQRPTAVVLGLIGLLEILLLTRTHWVTGRVSVGGAASGPGDNVVKLGRSLFTQYLYPFEITSVLLIIAVVGAVVLARRPPRPERVEADEPVAAGEAEGAVDRHEETVG